MNITVDQTNDPQQYLLLPRCEGRRQSPPSLEPRRLSDYQQLGLNFGRMDDDTLQGRLGWQFHTYVHSFLNRAKVRHCVRYATVRCKRLHITLYACFGREHRKYIFCLYGNLSVFFSSLRSVFVCSNHFYDKSHKNGIFIKRVMRARGKFSQQLYLRGFS